MLEDKAASILWKLMALLVLDQRMSDAVGRVKTVGAAVLYLTSPSAQLEY